jgi:hypothetical protein
MKKGFCICKQRNTHILAPVHFCLKHIWLLKWTLYHKMMLLNKVKTRKSKLIPLLQHVMLYATIFTPKKKMNAQKFLCYQIWAFHFFQMWKLRPLEIIKFPMTWKLIIFRTLIWTFVELPSMIKLFPFHFCLLLTHVSLIILYLSPFCLIFKSL